jgi:hypothetical protein
LPYLYPKAYGAQVPRLNPAQHKLFLRHVERAVETLREGDRLLRGAVSDVVDRCIAALRAEAARVDKEAASTVRFALEALPVPLVPYLEDPFAQGLAFNLHCQRTNQSHTLAAKNWPGGTAAVAARNLVFLPPVYYALWQEGLVDKTRLVNISNRNLTSAGYAEVAELVRSRRKEDVDARLLRMPVGSIQMGRRGPAEALEAAERNGWRARLAMVEVPSELVVEAGQEIPDEPQAVPEAEPGTASPAASAVPPPAPVAAATASPAEDALRSLRAGLSGARIAPEVAEALRVSPDPAALVERYLTAHRKTGDPDPAEVTRTLFFAHAGPMARLVADDKLLLRHFRPVKTQKRGQLFYRLLEAIEEELLERNHLAALADRGLSEPEAMAAVRRVIVELNRDPNRFLVVPDEWLGEVTRRHLYFGSRTRKEGAAFKWFRKIGPKYYLGAHKTQDELLERAARRAGRETAGAEEDDESF